MPFEIVGDIESVEVIATGMNSMAKVAGRSSKAKRGSASKLAQYAARRSIRTKRKGSAGNASKSRFSSADPDFVVCIDPAGNDDLQVRRIYLVLADKSAARSAFLRIIDDSGEDYLYPASCFVAVDLPKAVRDVLHVVA